MWALVGLAMAIGLAETREAKIYGSDLNPLNLQQTAAVLGYLALPAATLAGASVAEVTVRATVAATQNVQRFAKQGWLYLILIVVVCIRLTQCVWLIAQRRSGGGRPDLAALGERVGRSVRSSRPDGAAGIPAA